MHGAPTSEPILGTSYLWPRCLTKGWAACIRNKLSMATMLNKGMGCLHSEQVSISANHPSTNKVTNFDSLAFLIPLPVSMFGCLSASHPTSLLACLPSSQPACMPATPAGSIPACQPSTHLIAPDHGEFLRGGHFGCQKSQHGQTPDRTRPWRIPAREPLQLPKEPT